MTSEERAAPTEPTEPGTGSEPRGPAMLRGTPVAPGLAIGPAFRKDYDLSRVNLSRIPLERVELELNRFHAALSASKEQLHDLKERLHGKVPVDHVRILDTHVAYLKDSVFLSDVENLILNEQMSLEGAIAKVILDFDRIFRLVSSETLRDRAVDLRDVGIRVLRSLEREERPSTEDAGDPDGYILVARELSIVDMFNLRNDQVLGILTQEGSLTSHAAILARSMRIPTLTGVEGLLDEVEEGDLLILDAAEGVARVRPDEIVRAQYREAREAREARERERSAEEQPAWSQHPARTADGEEVFVAATCGNLPEAEAARALGLLDIGLYRTELLYLIDRDQPSLDSLIAHYDSVLEQAAGHKVTFRLLDLDSSLRVGYLHESEEQNPGLGRLGVRALLAHEQVLRRQLQAILRAGAALESARVRIAVPKVIDCGEFRRVKEILFEERFALKKAQLAFNEHVEMGVIIELPAAIIGARDFAAEADFLVISLNSLQQYLLAADRDEAGLARYFERIHPFVVRALADVAAACTEHDKPVSIFGVTTAAPETMTFLLGLGFRHFCVAPVALESFLSSVGEVDLPTAVRAVELARKVSSAAELQQYGGGTKSAATCL